MPSKPPWLLKIPDIIGMLETFDVPVVDRAVIERLFGLRRRRAIELLHRFGGYQAGRTFLIGRRNLVDQLRRLAEGEDFELESRRKERLDLKIDEIRRSQVAARVRIPVKPDMQSGRMTALSSGVALQPGHLHMHLDSLPSFLYIEDRIWRRPPRTSARARHKLVRYPCASIGGAAI